MAGKITHVEVLTQVKKKLEHGTSEQKKIAEFLYRASNRKYGYVGTIAPDIFYYYHFLSREKNEISQIWGDLHHHKNVTQLVLNFLDIILDSEETVYRDKLIAFTLGYICHCVVDVITHPYIFYISGDYYNKDPKISLEAQQNHMKVEFALDSYLLDNRWGMSPKEYDFTHYIDIVSRGRDGRLKMDPIIWLFWQQALKLTFPEEFQKYYLGSEKKIIPMDIINDSYIGYLRFQNLLDSRSDLIRGILKFFDTITLNMLRSSVLLMPFKENIDPRVMNLEEKEWYFPADVSQKRNCSFITLVNNAANTAKDVITTAWDYLKNNVKRETILNEYGGYNLDTGLRYQSIHDMKEFAPL
ncbi:MAG: zinc dependent phospholipase C family protein [Leptospiraceae bacterium]|nr:zinc dependent phospholipase C family protein [Leptospiraceae bacterium]MCP5496180.1 zinc dependent phospholipase C family protein [Leptospiraceae bacterium]